MRQMAAHLLVHVRQHLDLLLRLEVSLLACRLLVLPHLRRRLRPVLQRSASGQRHLQHNDRPRRRGGAGVHTGADGERTTRLGRLPHNVVAGTVPRPRPVVVPLAGLVVLAALAVLGSPSRRRKHPAAKEGCLRVQCLAREAARLFLLLGPGRPNAQGPGRAGAGGSLPLLLHLLLSPVAGGSGRRVPGRARLYLRGECWGARQSIANPGRRAVRQRDRAGAVPTVLAAKELLWAAVGCLHQHRLVVMPQILDPRLWGLVRPDRQEDDEGGVAEPAIVRCSVEAGLRVVERHASVR